MRDYLDIIKRNFFTPIVIGILLLAGALIYVREYRDAWFISVVIIVNSLIGIVQELRAKHALRKLELMSAPTARRVLLDGEIVEVPYDELRVSELVELQSGDEVPADATVIESRGLEIDESMLTGESIAVGKNIDDAVYASTAVVAGSARVRVVATGDDTRAGQMSRVLKRYKPELTPLQKAIQKAISFLTFGAIGLSVLIFIVYYLSGDSAVLILKTITSAAVTVVPEGLLLASSLLLAFGSLKLAQAKVLPQKLSAIEGMALLDTLCVDKTGTLTQDRISFDELRVLSGDGPAVSGLLSVVAHEASGSNDTGKAISAALKRSKNYELLDVLAFSSERKMSAVRIKTSKETFTVFMGAPEFIAKLIKPSKEVSSLVKQLSSQGKRVLSAIIIEDNKTALRDITKATGRYIAIVTLANPLRNGVEKTVAYLQGQGVVIKVISGDNPDTVKFVAAAAGISQPETVITGQELAELSRTMFAKAADEHTIFARVLPEQKERLIRHFQRRGYFTGMVGDGVNDALALKRADLGIAMYSGAAASRRVADLVLLNNSFTSLPVGMKLGNRIMQAIEVIATLFFHKIIYGVTLLLSTMVIGMTYPFAPRHITFMNMFLVTMPTIMWTLFPPLPRHRINPQRFWQDTLWSIAPIALLTGLATTFTYWIMSFVYPDRPVNVATITVLVATFFGVYMVYIVPQMLGVSVNKRSRRARMFYMAAVMFVALTSFSFGFLRDFFDFSLPTIWILWPGIGVVTLTAMIQWQLAKQAAKKFKDSLVEK